MPLRIRGGPPSNMARNWHIERLVRHDEASNSSLHEPANDRGVGRIAADHAMRAEMEEVTNPSDRSLPGGRRKISDFGIFAIVPDHELINFVQTKSRQFDRRLGDDQFFEFAPEL